MNLNISSIPFNSSYSSSVSSFGSSTSSAQPIALAAQAPEDKVTLVLKRSLDTELYKAKRTYLPEPHVPLRLNYTWENTFIEEITTQISSFKDNDPVVENLDDFFNKIKLLNQLPFGKPRITELLKLFDYKSENNLYKDLIYNTTKYTLTTYCTREFDHQIEDTIDCGSNEILMISLSSDEDDATLDFAIFLNTFHGELPLLIGSEALGGGKLKEIVSLLSNTFLTQILVHDEAKLRLGYDLNGKYILSTEPYESFNLSIWQIFARNNPHTFYGSIGCEPYTYEDRLTVFNWHQNKEVFDVSHNKLFYNAAVHYVRNIPTAEFSKCIIDSRDLVEFDTLVQKYKGDKDTLTVLAQKVDKLRHENDMVFLNVMVNLLRPLKEEGEEAFVWLALRAIKVQSYHIAKPPFQPVFIEKSDYDFALLAKQEINASKIASVKEFGKKFFLMEEFILEINDND